MSARESPYSLFKSRCEIATLTTLTGSLRQPAIWQEWLMSDYDYVSREYILCLSCFFVLLHYGLVRLRWFYFIVLILKTVYWKVYWYMHGICQEVSVYWNQHEISVVWPDHKLQFTHWKNTQSGYGNNSTLLLSLSPCSHAVAWQELIFTVLLSTTLL